jgi:hypothetical protein
MELQSNSNIILGIYSSIAREIEDIATNIYNYRAITLDYPGKPAQITLKQDLREDFREFIKREEIVVPRGNISSSHGFQCYMKYRWRLNKVSSIHLPIIHESILRPPVYLTCNDDMIYMLKLKCPNLDIKVFHITLVDV